MDDKVGARDILPPSETLLLRIMVTSTPQAARGMVVAPHHLAAQAGLAVLRDGGNAIEAAVATAAAIAVLYPHMNSLGGDNFWLISDGGPPRAIDACGPAAAAPRSTSTGLRGSTRSPNAVRWRP